jgi:hypothetical protein
MIHAAHNNGLRPIRSSRNVRNGHGDACPAEYRSDNDWICPEFLQVKRLKDKEHALANPPSHQGDGEQD